MVDYGYWYSPDGRSAKQQQDFEAVEAKPQALEWFFSKACDFRFRVSIDNLSGIPGEEHDTSQFRQRVLGQALHWQCEGLPNRAAIFFEALSREYGQAIPPGQLRFTLNEMG
jgi:elongation factor P hydroxylase